MSKYVDMLRKSIKTLTDTNISLTIEVFNLKQENAQLKKEIKMLDEINAGLENKKCKNNFLCRQVNNILMPFYPAVINNLGDVAVEIIKEVQRGGE